MGKKVVIPTVLYTVLIVVLMYVIVFAQSFVQIPVKVFCSLMLFTIYIINVPKEHWNKNYFTVQFLFFLGDVFYSYPIRFFHISLVFYVAVYIAFSIYLYKKGLKNKDWFLIFTFALPFLFTYGIIFTLLRNLDMWWGIGIGLVGIVICVNASLVVLSYAYRRSKRNLFFFVGVFLIQMVNFLAGVYYFNEQNQSYYLIINGCSLVAQYLICLGFIVSKKEEI